MAQKIYTDLDVKGKITSQNDEIQIGKTTVIVPQAPAGEQALSITIPTTESIQSMIDSSEVNQYIITGEYGKTPSEVLKAHTFSPEPKDGDTAVVRIPLFTGEFAEQRYSYTAYVFDNNIEPAEGETKWVAMDGNYSATNVYFTKNIEMAGGFTSVGNIKESDKTLEINGKSLADLISNIFQKELQGSTTWPSFTVSTTSKSKYEVGTSVAANYSVTTKAGSYTYGPDTGVTWSNLEVTFNGETLTGTSGTFSAVTLTDDHITTGLSFSANGDHSEGAAPKTNLGNPSSTEQITAKTDVAAASVPTAIKAYRGWFYGYKTAENALDVTALTSNNIRGLSSGAKDITTFPGTMSTTNMKQMFWACPTTSVGTKTLKVVGQPAPRTVYTTTVDVNDASGGNPIEYTVFYVNAGSANEGSENFTVTFA